MASDVRERMIPASSPILPIAANLDPAIDMVVSGHTHQPYVCDVEDPEGQSRLLTSASSFGRLYTETNLTYDRRTRDIVRSSVKGANFQVSRDVKPDPMQAQADRQVPEAGRADRQRGHRPRHHGRDHRPRTSAGESQLGDLIADAQLADDSVVTGGEEPVIAFMNPGGIRTDLTSTSSDARRGAG